MHTKETIEGNTVIAQYQGVTILSEAHVRENTLHKYVGELKYRESWDWLMPVWNKLINDGIDNRLEGQKTVEKAKKMEASEWHQICVQALMTAELSLFWGGIVSGVEWMNERNNARAKKII